jgi:uncharacterized protein (TIGR02246 family)
MKTFNFLAMAFLILGMGTLQSFQPAGNSGKETNANSEKQAVEKVINSYQEALNASNAERVVTLFTKDGVLMANAAPTAEGAEAVKGTYQYVFDNFTYDLKFTVLDVVVSGNTAYARSQSKGSFIIKASGQKVDDEFRELFVFEKQKGEWKIARYMYNKSK